MHTKTVRNSNLELYRIIVMFAIVAHYYVVNSGLMGDTVSGNDFNTRDVFFLLFGMWGKTFINICCKRTQYTVLVPIIVFMPL